MLSYLGKVLIVVSLCFQAYILLERKSIAQDFNNKLLAVLESCNKIPDHIAGYILFYARFVVVGLLGSAVLMLVSKFSFFKLLPLIALISLTYLEHHNLSKMPCVGCTDFWTKISQIGALIYLMGADCTTVTTDKVKVQEKIKQGQKLKAKLQ